MTAYPDSLDAIARLEASLEDGEHIEAVVIGDWATWGDTHRAIKREHGEPKPHVPFDVRGKAMPLSDARRYLTGWKIDGSFGAPERYPIYAWSNRNVFFVHEYDGSTHLVCVPRNPVDVYPQYDGIEFEEE